MSNLSLSEVLKGCVLLYNRNLLFSICVHQVRIYSLEAGAGFGAVLRARPVHAAHCLTSIQFSPTSEHLLLAYGRCAPSRWFWPVWCFRQPPQYTLTQHLIQVRLLDCIGLREAICCSGAARRRPRPKTMLPQRRRHLLALLRSLASDGRSTVQRHLPPDSRIP